MQGLPVQAESQHTPSAQKPLAQSVEREQVCPIAALHAPAALHVWLPKHSDTSSLFVTGHAWQAVLHAVEQHTPSTQNPLAHCPVAEHVWPDFFLQTPFASHVLVPEQMPTSSPFFTGEQVPGVLEH